MKVAVLLAYAFLTTRRVTSAAIKAPLDVISLDDITQDDRKTLEFLDHYYHQPTVRPKRSGEHALNALKAAVGNGIKSKLGLLAKGSASAISHFSSGSSSSGQSYHHHYDTPETYDHKSLDFWSLKKSILNTLLQAVKAIKGGVIAIKGQLIKGSGYLISAKGKLISAKGEAISNVGKNIATSAVLSPPHGHSTEYTHGHYHHSGPEEYGAPSAPGPEYDVPDHHYHHHPPHHEDAPSDADHAGILILKKIPKHETHEHVEHVPDFKPIEQSGPGWGQIIGKFFSASTSLQPGVPAPFGDEHKHQDHHHHSSHEEYHHDHHPSSHHESHNEYHSDAGPSKPSGHVGLFEEAPEFLNVEEYASESKNNAQTATEAPTPKPKPEPPKLQATPVTYDEIRPLPTAFSNTGVDMSLLNLDQTKPATYNSANVNFPPYPSMAVPSVNPTALSSDTTSLQFGAYPNTGSGLKYLAPTAAGPQALPYDNFNSYPNFYQNQYNGFLDNVPHSSNKVPLKRPPRSKHNSAPKRHIYPSVQFMRQLMHEVGQGRT